MIYLLVDDDPADLELLRVALCDVVSEHEIVTFTDAESAIEWLENGVVDDAQNSLVLLTDLKMPRCDGVELVESIRRRWPPGPISIVLSTSKRSSDANRAYAAGAHAYHSKPMGFHETVALCRRIDTYWASVVLPAISTDSP